ncbi:hypothetical protein Q0Z83_068010 [Actinoplanes sichuanensis]|uniref:YbhN family protein n=1 Tax=Actinoplanes sichuanensis TaxID=512349 RepID=A0ABW4AC55_9ACTN|nr:YbhN family protein [Actinoplanes sichuanensis]BEL08610.1 hypothetical protein Q0Z83_068010 [Actinoplanes sichuanensis]
MRYAGGPRWEDDGAAVGEQADGVTSIVESAARGLSPIGRRWLRVGLILLVGVVAVVALRGRIPDVADVGRILLAADPWWTVAAAGAALASQMAFAAQQRRLLAGLGVDLPPGRAVALTLSRSAISMAVPAGSAVSAAFAFRIYQRHGASGTVAAIVTAVSGILSAAALGLLYGAGWLVADPSMIGLVVGGGALAVPLLGLIWSGQRDRIARGARRIARRRPALGAALRGLRDLPRRSWLGALRAALVNWSLDMSCLAAAAVACGGELGWGRLALIYLAVQVVRQVPITPGGVGLIEASMLAGLMAAGMPEATGAAVVLLYRLASFWMMLPLGLLGWLRLRTPVWSSG